MTELKYRHDPPLVKGLYSVYMAGSIECAFSQHPDCMEIDGCLFHKGASGCRIEYFYSDKCRSEQAATVIRALVDSNRDFPEEIFVADPEYEYNSDVWVDLNEEQKDALRKAYAEAREKLYGGKKIMVVDPGHNEGSRAAETLCAVQDGVLVGEAKDISPNLNGDVILASENTGNPLLESIKAFKQQKILESGLQQRRDRDADVLKENHERMFGLMKDKSIEILPADETARISVASTEKKSRGYMKDFMELDPEERIRRLYGLREQEKEYTEKRSGIHADSTEIDGAIDILDHWDKVTKEMEGESCTLTRKSLRALRRSWGLDGKSRKRLRKKQEQVINQRDRKFRDRTRKLQKLLEYHIRSLEFVFQGPPFGNKNPGIAMDRRYAFPEMHKGIIEQIKCNTGVFLGLE